MVSVEYDATSATIEKTFIRASNNAPTVREGSMGSLGILSSLENEPPSGISASSSFTRPVKLTDQADLIAYPVRTQLKIYSYFNDTNVYYECSGALIDADKAITAGHCIYSHEMKQWADSVVIESVFSMDAIDGTFDKSYSRVFHIPEDYLTQKKPEDDLAVIELHDSLGTHLGWLGYEMNSGDHNWTKEVYHHFSYPSAYDNNDLYYSYGFFNRSNDEWLGNGYIASPGESGSVFIKNAYGSDWMINGVRTYSDVGFNRFGKTDIAWLNTLTNNTSSDFTPIVADNSASVIPEKKKKKVQPSLNTNEVAVSNEDNNMLVVFPNPTTSFLSLKLKNNDNSLYTISVYCRDGKLMKVMKSQSFSVNDVITIDLKELPKGYYYIFASNGENNYRRPIIKL